ncbi:hypothetical protein CspHIS471_0505240 [Cutaneotrichosporon sp. HIS471]|nr:hypothetical protein CspHIS471_0505240 [Cutaneotrichosporon sp. HIS471]
MALLRPRLSLGLASCPAVGSSSRTLGRGIRTGSPPRRPSDPDDEEGPVIELGGPPPPPPSETPRAYSYTNGYSGRSEKNYDAPRYDAPRYDTTHNPPRYDTPAYPSHNPTYPSHNPAYPPHSASYEPLKAEREPPQLERDSEVTAPSDVRVKVEGAPRTEDKPTEAPILLSADAPPLNVPRIAAPQPDSAPEPPQPSDSTSSASEATPAKEEWERKYEELQAAYAKKMDGLRAAMDERRKKLALQTGETLALVSQKVNEVTGYREVERLKQSVKDREQQIKEGRTTVREAKKAYEDAVATLSSTQQSVNALLERKHSWSDQDVATFTKLVRSDHASRAAVASTNDALKTAELDVDKAFTGLMQSILERYHEEQVWSDKIRSVSTWAQVAALVANLIVFMSAIAFIEPWKRRRLVQGLEERVSGMMGRVEGEIQGLADKVGELDTKIAAAAVVAATTMPAGVADMIGGEVVGEGEAALVADSEAQAQAVAALVNGLLADALSSEEAVESPLEDISDDESYSARAMQWTTAQLGHIAAPSPERDLAAAGLLGAVAGATVIGVCSLIAGLLRS